MIDLTFKSSLLNWCRKYQDYIQPSLINLIQATQLTQTDYNYHIDQNVEYNPDYQQLSYILKDMFEVIKQGELTCVQVFKHWCNLSEDDLVAMVQSQLELFLQTLDKFFALCIGKLELINIQNNSFYLFSTSRRLKSTEDTSHYVRIICYQLVLLVSRMEQIDSIYSSIRLKMQYSIDQYNAICLQQEDDDDVVVVNDVDVVNDE
jgi:hypothetical protein